MRTRCFAALCVLVAGASLPQGGWGLSGVRPHTILRRFSSAGSCVVPPTGALSASPRGAGANPDPGGGGDELSVASASVTAATEVLRVAAVSKDTDPEEVVSSLQSLEKGMRKLARNDPSVAEATLQALDGAWRLVFTTGTATTQKRLGGAKINYFPIKAVQCFDTSTMRLTNGIYLRNFPVVKFFGPFTFDLRSRTLEFDFEAIAVLGLIKIPLGKGKAAEIGSQSGLGSEGNMQLVEAGKRPFFKWISADANIATARGGGGGLALWRRDPTMAFSDE